MAGLINSQLEEENTAPPPAESSENAPTPQAPQGAAPKGGAQYKTKVADTLPPNLRDAFERVVLAGMKIFYSPQMKQTIQQELAKPGPVEKKLAEGVAGLMALIDSQAQKGLPREVIIPAAIELLAEIADFLSSAGEIQITPDQLQKATMYLAVILAKRYGASDQQIQQMFQGQQAAPAPQDDNAEEEAAEPEQTPEEESDEEEE